MKAVRMFEISSTSIIHRYNLGGNVFFIPKSEPIDIVKESVSFDLVDGFFAKAILVVTTKSLDQRTRLCADWCFDWKFKNRLSMDLK